ncbi:MAG TPA: KH domain-containing protein [Acidimicrobiales bacterium]|nr:KH domain-containing protein [Acidimicrobiales bacterium]
MSEDLEAPGEATGAEVSGAEVTGAEILEEDLLVAPDDGAGNRVVGAGAKGVLEYLARQIVDEPEAVVIEPDERGPDRLDLRLHVAPDDMGKIIGRRGRVAQAIRTVVRAVGAREGVETTVDIVD